MHTNKLLLRWTFRFWFVDALLSGINFSVFMILLYEPMWGPLVSHQIGMTTRILYIFILAFFLLRIVKEYEIKELFSAGLLWLGMTLLFEWGGSALIGRPVEDTLIGWNIIVGYMWPYVLATYFFSIPVVGAIHHSR